MKKTNKLFLFACLFFKSLSGQDLLVRGTDYGFNIGLNLALGTHFQRAGINLNFFYVSGHLQLNTELRAYYSMRNLGPDKKTPEIVLSQGILYAYANRDTVLNPFYSSISNQTGYRSSFAYSYNLYFNTIYTSQQTGILAIEVQRFSLIAENDLLAKPALDRFRTGAFLIQYQPDYKVQLGINCTMWTGRMGQKSGILNPKFYYDCYMDTIGGVYPNTSHGLLSAQVRYYSALGQNFQASAGIDAEQVRDAVQNTFIHDMRWIPKKYNKSRNCHIPMIASDGTQYLYDPDQRVRPAKPYLNFFANPNVFY